MKTLTLVVMAGGMGSRFGGLKQITPVDDEDNFIIDYSIYDAIKAGFTKVVFVIKEEHYQLFKSTIGRRLSSHIKVEYAFQSISDIPQKKHLAYKREKPWGTVQALLVAKPYVDGPFAVINADDFYGLDAYMKIAEFFKKERKENEALMISYHFNDTITSSMAVKRGVCLVENDEVKKITECSIKPQENNALATPLDGKEEFLIKSDALVSMNCYGFSPHFFTLFEDYFYNFFNQDDEQLLKEECLLPTCLNEYLKENKITIYSMASKDKWLGMTYKSDLEIVKNSIMTLKKKGTYPNNLWR